MRESWYYRASKIDNFTNLMVLTKVDACILDHNSITVKSKTFQFKVWQKKKDSNELNGLHENKTEIKKHQERKNLVHSFTEKN